MAFNKVTMSLTTITGTFVIVSLPGTSREEFVNTLREAMDVATPTPKQRDTNVVSQELLSDESQVVMNTCLWSLRFNGIHAPDTVRTKCQSIYDSVREKVEVVGTRESFRLETLKGAWEAD